jgi:hypothetical protein
MYSCILSDSRSLKAFNVWYAFFWTTNPSLYQLALCLICAQELKSNCKSDMCERRYMDIVVSAAETGEIPELGKRMLRSLASVVDPSSSSMEMIPNAQTVLYRRKAEKNLTWQVRLRGDQ